MQHVSTIYIYICIEIYVHICMASKQVWDIYLRKGGEVGMHWLSGRVLCKTRLRTVAAVWFGQTGSQVCSVKRLSPVGFGVHPLKRFPHKSPPSRGIGGGM